MKQWQNLTDMLKNQDVFDEMSKKYKNTILGIKTNVKSIYATFIGNDDMFVFRDEHGQQLKIADNTDMEIFIPNPEKGLYNTPLVACVKNFLTEDVVQYFDNTVLYCTNLIPMV